MLKKFIKNKLDNYSFVRGDINLNDRNGMLHRVWGYVFSNHLFGDYIEFGVYKALLCSLTSQVSCGHATRHERIMA